MNEHPLPEITEGVWVVILMRTLTSDTSASVLLYISVLFYSNYMKRIDIPRIASILADTSWMDRLDLTSPSKRERSGAALIIAETIVAGLELVDEPRLVA